jgi:competence protein ComEC
MYLLLPGFLKKQFTLLISSSLFISIGFSACTSVASKSNQSLDLYWIDVEGGAATLLVTPTGESVLFDTGNPGDRDADRIYRVATEAAGLKQIDHLVTTHFHIDHFGGAAELARMMPIAHVHDKGIPDALPEDPKFAERIQPYRDLQTGQRSLITPGYRLPLQKKGGRQPLTVSFLGADRMFVPIRSGTGPGGGCGETTRKAEDKSDNGNSTAFVLEYGPFRFFHGADMTWNVEEMIVCPENLPGEVDLFQVNHHGLDQSNNPVLVHNLSPTVTVMNNGTRKGCGPETVTTLRNTPSVKAMYQVHKNLREDSEFNTADAYIANLEEACAAHYIKLSVAPDGQSYTVSIPARNHQATYQTKRGRRN